MDSISRLQMLDPQQFTELCIMHISFSIDLQNIQLKDLLEERHGEECKPKRFFRKCKENPISENPPSLTPERISQIHHIIEYLNQKHYLEQEGLFRKSGSVSRQEELKTLLNSGKIIDFKNLDQYSVHDCASILKKFFSELPDPVLSQHYSMYCKIAEMKKDDLPVHQKDIIFEKQVKSIKLMLLLLPPDYYTLMKHLLQFLYKVKEAKDKNLMTSENLAKIFIPHLLCPKNMPSDEFKCNSSCMVKIIECLIDNAMLLFDPPLELVQDVKLRLKEVETRKSFQSNYQTMEPINTTVLFCARSDGSDYETTKKALEQLKEHVQQLPESEKKKKLLKKFKKENINDDKEEIKEKRSKKSAGEALKKYFKK